MSQVGFYHLTRTSPEAALPALLEKTLQAGERAVVLCGAERVPALDLALWRGAEWLPHGTAAMGFAERQPVWITAAEEAPNGARFLFLLDGRTAALARFARVFDLFEGGDETAVAAARGRYAAAREAGHGVEYWRQGARGWERG